MQNNLYFLEPLNLKPKLADQCPSKEFERGLNEWQKHRSHELRATPCVSYRYYIETLASHAENMRFEHSLLARGELDVLLTEYGASYTNYKDYPARELSGLAYLLGWRLVPFMRWAEKYWGKRGWGDYTEVNARDWAAQADMIYHLLAAEKVTKKNVLSQQATVAPVRDKFWKLVDLCAKYADWKALPY